MKLLILTQAVDEKDSNLGFFTRWIAEFAKHAQRVEVICLREGAHDLPANVHVHALGQGRRIARGLRFLQLIWQLREEYDAVFIHMNPEYIVLGGLFWRFWHKPVALWYAHKSVTAKLRIAAFFASYIFTVADDSFRIATDKKRAVGHGIDTERFKPVVRDSKYAIRLLMVGRITESKHLLEMLPLLDILDAQGRPFSLEVIGLPLTARDAEYQQRLRDEIRSRPYAARVSLLGAVAHERLLGHLAAADVALNFSSTGNMDKTGLEALATGLPLVTTNQAFAALGSVPGVFLEKNDPPLLAAAVIRAAGSDAAPAAALVIHEHSLAALIPRIMGILTPHEPN